MTPVKFVPVTMTDVPPTVRPEVGLRRVTVGAGGAVNVNWSALEVADVPLAVVTVMSTVPALSAGAMALTEPSELTVKLVAAVAPKKTLLAAVKPLPRMVTVVPPAMPPVFGVTEPTTGAGFAE
jgi:hypothetical protein